MSKEGNFLVYCTEQYKSAKYHHDISLKAFLFSERKENIMDEPMTDFQLKTLLKMVLEILKSCKSIEEAIAKIEGLINEPK